MEFIFTRDNSFSSLKTQALTFCKWSHVAVLMPDGRIMDSMKDKGVRPSRTLAGFLAALPDNLRIPVYGINEAKAVAVANSMVGWKYDDKTQQNILMPWKTWTLPNTISCSGYALEVAGWEWDQRYDGDDLDRYTVTPADLYNTLT